MAKIFISYAREDREIARRLYDYLRSHDQEPWLDIENLIPGQKWEIAIQSAIRESNFFIALLSPHSIEKRGYVQKELREGLDMLDRIPDSQVFLIPVRIGDCEPQHDRLRELQWVDLLPDWEAGLRRLDKVFSFVPAQVLARDLSGTKWQFSKTYGSKQWNFILSTDGTVEQNKRGKYQATGTWTQSGNVVYMSFNSNYAQYKGVIEGERLRGEAQNVRGDEWQWEAILIEKEETVSPSDREREEWARLSLESLARAYSNDEPEYSLDRITEANPAYEGR